MPRKQQLKMGLLKFYFRNIYIQSSIPMINKLHLLTTKSQRGLGECQQFVEDTAEMVNFEVFPSVH